MDGGVADGVGVVVVVDDLKVSDGFTFGCCGEMNLRFGFTGSLCVNGEVSGFPHLNTCRGSWEIISACQVEAQTGSEVFIVFFLTCLVESRSLCSDFSCIMGRINLYSEGADGDFLFGH